MNTISGKIIDRTGRILAETSRWGRVITWDIDLNKGWFHTDCSMSWPSSSRSSSRI